MALTGLFTLLTAAAAVTIPLVVDANLRDSRTLDVINKANHEIAKALADKAILDKKYDTCAPYSYRYLSEHLDAEAIVFTVLNEYEYICLGGNEKILNNELIDKLRGNALHETFKDYKDYIEEHRKRVDEDAWQACTQWLSRFRRARGVV